MSKLSWDDVEKSLDTMTPVEGGSSHARRGLITLPNGQQVFVKQGTEPKTKKWAKKEIAVYGLLKRHGFNDIPKLLATSPDKTAFALEALTPETGWDWTNQWDEERLKATLQAMDKLVKIVPASRDEKILINETPDRSDDGWEPLAKSKEMQHL